MSGGLVALLDDVAALAKLAAASIDDIGAAAGRAGVKAIGVVVDDTAVTPSYVTGFTPYTSAVIISALSAIGSAIFPKSVTNPRARAMSPSSLSVSISTANRPNAHHHCCERTSHANTGMKRIRTEVSTFGRFQLDCFAGSDDASPDRDVARVGSLT